MINSDVPIAPAIAAAVPPRWRVMKTVTVRLPADLSARTKHYLKLTGYRLGILINFNTKLIKDGLKRIVL